MGFQWLLLILAITLLDYGKAEPLDIVDSCLLTCESCFKGAVLVNCANECLMIEISKMNPIWEAVCPYFGKPNYSER